MQPENAQEEFSEAIKHFGEKVPPESDVWGEIGKEQLYAVGGGNELPGGACEQIREVEKGNYDDCQRCEVRYCEDDEIGRFVDSGCGRGLPVVANQGKRREKEKGVKGEVGGKSQGDDIR